MLPQCCQTRNAYGREMTDPNLPSLPIHPRFIWLEALPSGSTNAPCVSPAVGRDSTGCALSGSGDMSGLGKSLVLCRPQRGLGSSSGHTREGACQGGLVAWPVSRGPATGEHAGTGDTLRLLPPTSQSLGADSGQVNSPSLTGHPCDPLERGTLESKLQAPPPPTEGRWSNWMDGLRGLRRLGGQAKDKPTASCGSGHSLGGRGGDCSWETLA